MRKLGQMNESKTYYNLILGLLAIECILNVIYNIEMGLNLTLGY